MSLKTGSLGRKRIEVSTASEMRNICFEGSLLCFYRICRITTFDCSFTVPVITVLLPPSNFFSTSYLQKYWLQLQSVSGIKRQLSLAIMIKMWLQMPAQATAWSLTIAMKKTKQNNIRDTGELAQLWHCGLCFLFVVCNLSEKHVPLRNAPRLLQLMTYGGSPLGAVWEHFLRY